MSLVYGYIFEWDGFQSKSADKSNSERFNHELLSISEFRPFVDKNKEASPAPRWAVYHFHSPKPLLGEEVDPMNLGGGYLYKLYVRVNQRTGTLVIAGARYSVTEEAVRTFNTYIKPSLQRKMINIRSLSEHLFQRGTKKEFSVTHFSADVPGHGTAVKSISISGDDIGAADFLVEERLNFAARQVGVRPHAHPIECGRFGSVGSVQFRTDLLANFERFLVYAYQHGLYID